VGTGTAEWLVTVPHFAERLAFSADGKSIAVLCGRASIHFLDPKTGTTQHEIKPSETLDEPRWMHMAVAARSQTLVVAAVSKQGEDGQRLGNVELWAVGSATINAENRNDDHADVGVRRFRISEPVNIVAASENGELVAVANTSPTLILQVDGTSRVQGEWKPLVEVRDAVTGGVVANLQITSEQEDTILAATKRDSHVEVTAVALSPDARFVAVGTSIGQLKLFNARSGELVRSFDDQQSRLADEETPDSWREIPRGLGSVQSLAFSPDGKSLAACGQSFGDFGDVFDGIRRLGRHVTGPGRLKVWDVRNGTLQHDLAGHSHAEALAFHPDGQLLGSAGRWSDEKTDGAGVILWDLLTGERVRSIAADANGGVHTLAFSPDGKRLVYGALNFDPAKMEDPGQTTLTVAHVGSGAVQWLRVFPGWAKPKFYEADVSLIVLRQGALQFVDGHTGKTLQILRPAESTPEAMRDFATARKGQMLVYGGVDEEGKGLLEVWGARR
jgi:WD40 repeat protein